MILALHAAGPTTSMWLLDAANNSAGDPQLIWDSGRNLSTELLSQLQSLLADHNLTLSDLSGLIVFSGPGSFTSLRIGHTVLNALADSLQIPIIGTTGDDWLSQGLTKLPHTPASVPALPAYGSEAHITHPQKQPKS
ncbi:tRNA (adenosine(37)-N6)-threonylcarbamoyltransferase complex dimerization subunit type 1 TsaB [bacterium]|nr:MAG: tRNA (adenosine(37)-N6)-threonylcarbamoyltransferase complex dimerization subunit type 1 TsaB [bacterium]